MNRLFQSKVSLPGIAVGIVITLSCNTLLLSLMAAMGLWSYKPADLPHLGPGFWGVSASVWILSLMSGVFIGSLVSGRTSRQNMVLSAISIWAGSYIIFGGLLPTIAEINTISFMQLPQSFLWIGFAGDFLSLVAAIVTSALSFNYMSHSSVKKTQNKSKPKQEPTITLGEPFPSPT